jgi:hypothetical protein
MTSTPANIGRRYASLSDAAEYIGVNEKTVRRRIADGTPHWIPSRWPALEGRPQRG